MKELVFREEFDPFYFYHGSSQNWDMHGFHFHKSYEMILFMCDNAEMHVENRVYHVGKGDLFLINDQECHRTVGVKDAPYKRYVLMFEPQKLQTIGVALEYSFLRYFEARPENFIHKITLREANLQFVIKSLDEIENTHSLPQSAAVEAQLDLQIATLLIQVQGMFDFFVKHNPQISCEEIAKLEFTKCENAISRIENIKGYIENHLDGKITLDEIANEFFITRCYLSHYFKRETGFAISEYIRNQKISKAKKLLKQDYAVTQVAQELGFSSDSHFIDVFKQMTGITPKKYIIEKRTKQSGGKGQ